MSHKKSAKRAVEGQPSDANKDSSPHVYQTHKKLKQPLEIRQRYEFNDKQKAFVERAMDKSTRMILCDGIWGSSKTYNAVYCALRLLNDKRVESILYVRSPVESGQSIGFIPGSVEEKLNPYAEPFYQKLHELLDKPSVDMLDREGFVEIIPPGFSRGQSWNCKAVIVDEAANFSREMLELIISRIGPFCKVFIIGSRLQSDTGSAEGFVSLFKAFDDAESKGHGIHCFYFNEENDIVRSEFTKHCMKKLGVLKVPEPVGTNGDWVPSERA